MYDSLNLAGLHAIPAGRFVFCRRTRCGPRHSSRRTGRSSSSRRIHYRSGTAGRLTLAVTDSSGMPAQTCAYTLGANRLAAMTARRGS